MKVETIGFPKIMNFGGDIRDFLPSMFKSFNKYKNLGIFIERGYGAGFGKTEEDYLAVNPNIKFVDSDEVYKKDLIVIIKMPDLKNLEKLRDGNSIFTMCHYLTRPLNVEIFKRKNINAFSMDAVVDDYGKRIFVDYFGTAFNGSEIAFEELKKSMKDFHSENRRPINVSVLGVGGVAQNCAKAFEILSDREFLNKDIPGVIVRMLPRTVTYSDELLKTIFEETDILVDATSRADSSKCVVKNELVGCLPEHAIILDLTADRYEGNQVRPIEGTVLGSLVKKVIYNDDDLYASAVPAHVNKNNRRTTVSCNAWPGANPQKSIEFYEVLIKDYLNVLLEKDIDMLDATSNNMFERALYRSNINNFFKNNII